METVKLIVDPFTAAAAFFAATFVLHDIGVDVMKLFDGTIREIVRWVWNGCPVNFSGLASDDSVGEIEAPDAVDEESSVERWRL